MLDNTFSEQNYLARTVEVKSLEISFPTHSFFHPSLTSLVIYVSCKYIISYFLSLKYVNTDFLFNFDRSPQTLTENNRSVQSQAIRKVTSPSKSRDRALEADVVVVVALILRF